MTNKLIRSGYSYTIPETLPQPGRPGYWVHTTYTVEVPVRPIWSAGGGSSSGASGDLPLGGYRVGNEGTWVRVTDSYGAQRWVWMPTGASSGGSGGAWTTGPTVTKTFTESTWVPPVPAVPGSPARRIDSPPAGWTAFARSVKAVRGNAHAEFYVSAAASGVAIGLAPLAQPEAGYGHIPRGLLFNDGAVRNLRTGASYGSYSDGSKVEIDVSYGTINYRIGGQTVGSEPGDFALGAPLYLSAALYGNGDYVDQPVLTENQAGASVAQLSALAAFGGRAGATRSVATLSGLAAVSSPAARSRATLRPLAAFGGRSGAAGSTAALQALAVESYGGALVTVPATESFAQLGAPVAASVLLVGATGQGTATLGALGGLSSDRPYGYSRVTLRPPVALSYQQDAGTAYILDDAVVYVDVPMVGTTVNDVRMTPAVSVDVPTTAGQLQTVELRDHVTLDVVFSFTGEALADARDVIWFDVPLDVPGAFMDAWSVNADTGGSSTYDNFAFNSLACIGGRYFGAGEGGIFELVGDTDDGQPVRASLDLGLRNFGTSNLKTVDTCFLGMAATGHLYVKVLAEGNEHLYKTRSFSPQMQAQRVVFGRGLRTNYVGLQIFNEGGADFELDGLEFALTDLSRRV